jgi:Transglycosylase SLT domain
MAYVRIGEDESTLGSFGCGPGCSCAGCRQTAGSVRGLGERYVPEEQETTLPPPPITPRAVPPRSNLSGWGQFGEILPRPHNPLTGGLQLRMPLFEGFVSADTRPTTRLPPSPAPLPRPSASTAQAPADSLFHRIQSALASGQWYLALSLAVLAGNRNVNKLTNLIFFARHPERGGRKLEPTEPNFQQLTREWLDIRDRLVRPALLKLPSASPTPAIPRPSTISAVQLKGINKKTADNIDCFSHLINSIAPKYGVDPNIVRGIIAAESGGNPNSGAENRSGYKGLMQAGTGEEQLVPEISIRSGVEHFINKRNTVARILRSFGVDLNSLDQETMLRYIMTAYNAGEGTLKKALQYAQTAGDKKNWEQPEHFQRALFFTGAYSVRAPLRWCLGRLARDVAARAIADLTGTDSSSVLRDYYRISQGWNIKKIKRELAKSITAKLYEENKRFRGDEGLTLDVARRKVSPLLMCSVEFKHIHRPLYINTILRYKQHYDQRGLL